MLHGRATVAKDRTRLTTKVITIEMKCFLAVAVEVEIRHHMHRCLFYGLVMGDRTIIREDGQRSTSDFTRRRPAFALRMAFHRGCCSVCRLWLLPDAASYRDDDPARDRLSVGDCHRLHRYQVGPALGAAVRNPHEASRGI